MILRCRNGSIRLCVHYYGEIEKADAANLMKNRQKVQFIGNPPDSGSATAAGRRTYPLFVTASGFPRSPNLTEPHSGRPYS
jgi:hypothetical protein